MSLFVTIRLYIAILYSLSLLIGRQIKSMDSQIFLWLSNSRVFSKKISFGKNFGLKQVRSEILSGNWFCFRIRFFREIDKIQIKKRKTWSGLLGSNFKTLKKWWFYAKIMILLTMTHQKLNENDVTMTHHLLKW